ncbi:uncharacterized protein LOC132699110 [Cylas formicarius]|uniref:uncharacterized protein LOC132699110 n=1 Tax=Cylas formicarius TaxID=197179 RepID=UPI002958834E|nr:uncharacterized protein LOC132699110 [Cylas formicarius]
MGPCAGALLIFFGTVALSADIDIWNENNTVPTNDIRPDGARLPRVLNFFPVPVEEECNANDGRRNGVCMNTYECRIQGGKSHGFCAMGFGVCCVFTATCGQEIINNITYFVNPDFPDLTTRMTSCMINVKKIDPEIAQIKLDFIHFNIGQPNRTTGVCEEDFFTISSENSTKELKMCGLNSGQHIFYDVESIDVKIRVNLSRKIVARLWEVRVTQIPFTQRAPVGCLQYHQGSTGVIQTMNFADNGRHLADQDYNICIRQEAGACSIAYEPCHENAFRIAPNNQNGSTDGDLEELGSGQEETRSMEICNDKIIMPCDSDDLLAGMFGVMPGYCSLVHCGASLCPSGMDPCRIESSVTPFTIGVHFGPSARQISPDDNLGMCLTYEQLSCDV